jgi:tripartite-type tricarboxylate transporter receptor subunit TctC
MMPVALRRVLHGIASLAIAMSVSHAALSQAYPSRPIRMVVPSLAGTGVTDIMARLIAQPLGAALGQPVVIDNRAGAGGILGADIVAKAAPDGYTLLMTNIAFVVNPSLYPKLPYDPATDFTPVSRVNAAPLLLLVHPSVPVNSVRELIDLARSHPGQLNFASGGVGSTPHLSGELFKSLAGIDVVHVPYKSGPPAVSDLLAGQVSFMFENMPGTMPFVRAGTLRALAVTSARRSPLAPELPTMIEAGVPGYEMSGWNGIVMAKGTSPEIVARLSRDVAKILRTKEMTQQLSELGAEPVGDTPAAFGAFLTEETARWGKIIRERGIGSE